MPRQRVDDEEDLPTGLIKRKRHAASAQHCRRPDFPHYTGQPKERQLTNEADA